MSAGSKTGGWVGGLVTSAVVGVILTGVVYTVNRDRDAASHATSTNQIVVPASTDYVSPLGRIAQSVFPLDPTWFGSVTSSATSSSIQVTKKSATSTHTLIKDAEGKTYSDPKVLGMIDPTHVAVVADGEAGRAILSVTQDGQATPLATLSVSTTVPFLNNQGSVCLK